MSSDQYLFKIISFCIILGSVFYLQDVPVEENEQPITIQCPELKDWFDGKPIHLFYSYGEEKKEIDIYNRSEEK